jgi:amino acid adenylation domain-containing protein
MLRHFSVLLEGIVARPEDPVTSLPILSDAERELLEVWNDTGREYPREGWRLHHLCEQQAERTPDAVALVFKDERMSYGELNARANQLARHILRLGVRLDDPVGVYMERSVEMVISLLAILKAGACYQPLDPSYPRERLAFMLGDAGAKLLLTQEKFVGVLPEHRVKVVSVDGQGEKIDLESVKGLGSEVCPDNLAYLIYTSGSTGVPKGVMITHRGICNRLHWMQQQYGLTPTDRVLQKTTFGFDVSVWEFFWPLMTGACLVLAEPGGQQDSGYLTALIDREQVSVLHFVPSMLGRVLQERSLYRCGSLKRVICSGEALSLDLQKHFFERLDAELHNLYGPTEASVDVTYWECRRDSEDRTVPIGHAIANIRIHVLDKELQPMPVGVPGELHIAGIGLARGYVNRPDLTAEKFIPDPYAREPGGRMYKSGDLARYRADGSLEYIGRIDHQVKIRGFRIELGEIESTLNQHPEIKESAVIVREDSPGDQRLVAYIVAAASDPAIAAVRSFLTTRLPNYMVPAAFVTMESLPLGPSGKLDRQALPTPDSASLGLSAEFVAPRSTLEQELADIWARLLNVKRVGVHDNFFELGGHSMLLTQLATRILNTFGAEVPMRILFDAPTIEGISIAIGSQLMDQSDASDLALLLAEMGELTSDETTAL